MDMVLNEYVTPTDNKNVITLLSKEQTLENKQYEQIDYQFGKFKVVLEFPTSNENEDNLQKEVKDILRSELQERMKNIS